MQDVETALDKIPNYRDLAKYTSKIKPRMIYRSSHLAPHSSEDYFGELIEGFEIKTIIDLRWPTETKRFPYSEETIKEINYVNVPLLDTLLNKKDVTRFIPYNEKGGFYEIIPIYFKNQIKSIFEQLVYVETPIVIHCWSGKDRTGMMVALIHLLLDTAEEEILEDYLATGMTTSKEKIQPFLDIIASHGDVRNYLSSAGLTNSILNQVIQKYSK
ncbi:MAG: tyrosine-protein phosphatase [Candidatus Heimdallarchaeota archaeon]|nr:tyrosine-protein phosphatase [Candidatus Heimdallarchaeota archaeon]MCK4878407.1 tyrosine-protein phosphatase [Candidatus Heimdallarchaeota archaeon]